MLSLLSKIWLRYKKTMITSLKLHQIYFRKENTKPKTPKTALAEATTASAEAETAPAELATTSAKAETAPAKAANSFCRNCNNSNRSVATPAG